jgi:hypothetical protein
VLSRGDRTAYPYTFVGVDLEIELGKEQLPEVEQPNIHITAAKESYERSYNCGRGCTDLFTSFLISSAESGFCVS